MRKLFVLIIITVCSMQSQAQLQGQPLIDSLLSQLPQAKEDTNKVMLLNDLSLTYYSINPEEGLKFGKQALVLAEKLKWKKGMAYACKVIAGNYGYGKSDYAQALEYSLKGLQLFEETGDKTGTAKMLGDIGVVYWYMSDYPNALKYFFDALRIDEELGIKNEVAATLCNIGIIYNGQKDYDKALEYMLRANKIDEELKNKSGMASNLANIGELYMSLSDHTKALEYSSRSLQLCEELGDKNGLSRNFGIIGTVYSDKKEYNKALEYFFRALQLNKELENKIGIAMMLGSIGNTYLEMTKDTSTPKRDVVTLKKAKIYTDSAITICKEIGDLNSLSANYKLLSEIQTLLGDNRSALESYKNYALFKDSVFNMEKDKKLTETAMQYAFDKKEATAKAEQEKKDIRQRNIRNSIIAGAVVLLLLLVALINRYRYKQKANKELATAYENLKNTQQQLVRSEKMAAFGVMAKRMAHEIQNPLNFVNNFSELSKDLVQEIISSGNEEEKKEAAQDLISNLEKINHHGNRASSIINQLQEHARSGTAQQFFEEEKNL
ncbi:MAG TPA: tetratricopeptide repeat protein [Chitinophagaceae bacterium]